MNLTQLVIKRNVYLLDSNTTACVSCKGKYVPVAEALMLIFSSLVIKKCVHWVNLSALLKDLMLKLNYIALGVLPVS